MNQGFVNTVISAIVGGVVGAGVVFFAGGNVSKNPAEMAKLTVRELTITGQAVLLGKANEEGKQFPEVMIRDGSILVENLLLAKRMIARQIQGHAVVANRVFATPDDLINTPMENWKFYAELGASTNAGGEVVVRSVSGPAMVNRPTQGGTLLRTGFDTESKPQIIALQNASRSILPLSYVLSDEQQRELAASMANPQAMMPQANQGGFSGQSTPVGGDMIPTGPARTAAQPGGNFQ